MFGHEAKQTAFKILTMVSLFQEFRFLGQRTEMRATDARNSEGRAIRPYFFPLSDVAPHSNFLNA